jgi:hypothetical protein
MSLEVELLHRVEALEKRLDAHCVDHPLEHHDHLLDHEEHAAHHATMDAPRDKRSGEAERRKSERRVSTTAHEGEERRVA